MSNKNTPKECRYCAHCSLRSNGIAKWYICNKQTEHIKNNYGGYDYVVGLKTPAKSTCKHFKLD